MLRRIVVQLEWVRLFSLRIYRNLGVGENRVKESGTREWRETGPEIWQEIKI